MKVFLLAVVFLLAACATTAPSGFEDYCKRNPTAPACGGTK